MSWNDHVTAMINQGAVSACITGLDGNPWATSPGLTSMTPAEALVLIKAAKGQHSDSVKLQAAGVQYMMVGPLEGDISGVKLISKMVEEKVMLCVGLSNSAAVFVSKTGSDQRNAVGICEREVAYLKNSGM